jgi:hypothetical protein
MAALMAAPGALENARDRQDRAALEKQISELSAAAQKAPHDAEAQYRVALASSYLAEISLELRDKTQAEHTAESGIQAAERAIAINSNNAEYYRVLGTLCGQVVPANVLSAFSYGKRAREAIDKALELDPKSAQAYLARGVGNYYLPDALGGGASVAIPDFRKAADLDPKSAEAYLWLGLAERKEHHNAEARQAFARRPCSSIPRASGSNSSWRRRPRNEEPRGGGGGFWRSPRSPGSSFRATPGCSRIPRSTSPYWSICATRPCCGATSWSRARTCRSRCMTRTARGLARSPAWAFARCSKASRSSRARWGSGACT